MARVKVKLADNIARVVFIESDATNGARLGVNLFNSDGSVATPQDVLDFLAIDPSGSDGIRDHRLLRGLTLGDDHPQYTRKDTLTTRGDLYYRDATTVARLGLGTALQFLRSNGIDPAWQTVSPTITLGTDLSGSATLTDLGSVTLNATIVNNAVTDAKLRDSVGLSVIGRSANTTGDPADIVAASDTTLLRRSGTSIGFGTITAAYVSDFTEAAQDAVGTALTDSASVDFTYNDGANTITAAVIPGGVDHGGLAGLTDDDHPQYPLKAGIETISGTWTFSNIVTAPGVNGSATLQLQVAGTTQQYMTATQNSWALGTSVPSTSTTRHVFGVAGNQGIEIAALNGAPRWVSKRYNGAYAAPTKVVNGNALALFRVEGYQETTGAFTAYSALQCDATEDWTSTANGFTTTFRTAANGSATGITTLVLQGSQSQFRDGAVGAPAVTFQTDLDSGRYRIGADQYGDSAGGVLQLEIGSAYSDQKTQVRRTGVVSPAQLTANTDDWNPTGLSTAAVIRVSTDASRNLTGIQGGVAGRELYIINVGTQPLVLVNDATSTAANRFLLASGTNTTLQTNGCAHLWYDGTSARWRQIGRTA